MTIKNIFTTAALLIGLCGMARSQEYTVPTYVTTTATGTTLSTAYFPAQPLQQIRVVGAICISDLAGSVLSLSTGRGAYTVLSNATSSATTIYVVSTNGLQSGDALVLQTWGGTNAYDTVASNPTVSNAVVITAGGFGVAVTAGDQLYKMSTASALPIGSNTVNYQGEALYVGNKGRPVRATLNGTSANTINTITARYE
jgi:hypothetical protein